MWNKFQKFIQIISVVRKSGDFILTPYFAAIFHPVVKSAFWGQNQVEPFQGQVFVSFGFIIRIQFLQATIEYSVSCEVVANSR